MVVAPASPLKRDPHSRVGHNPRMAIAALAVVAVTSVALMVLGRRFTKRFVERRGVLPRSAWMFHRTDDPELESPRRLALGLLPIYLIAVYLWLFRPGP